MIAPKSIEYFQQNIEREFVEGSAIAPALFQATIRLCRDLETTLTGDVSTPIHDALNWAYARFGQRTKEGFYAALLLNEDGSCWQAKTSNPRVDAKGKIQKYEAPKDNGSRAFLPSIPAEIREFIADRHGVEVPLEGSFWDWLESCPNVPIVVTEGGKKALSLLSLGYVAIAAYGVNAGYSKRLDGSYSLIPDIARFTGEGRSVALAFDQDESKKTRRKVAGALFRFEGLLNRSGCKVSIAQWQGKQGKGVDDLIASNGTEAWHKSYREAIDFAHFAFQQKLEGRLTQNADIKLAASDLSELEIATLPKEGIIAIASPKGTGKTKFISQQVRGNGSTLAAGHRIALMRNLSERLGLTYRGDADKVNGRFIGGSGYNLRLGFCVDALLAIDPEAFRGCDLILDEVVQVMRHLLTSETCRKDGKRPALLARFKALIQVARRVIVADADLDNATLHYIKELRGENSSVFLIRNDFEVEGYPVEFVESQDYSPLLAQLLEELPRLAEGKVIYLATDSKAISSKVAEAVKKQYPEIPFLLINSQTSGGEVERGFVVNPHDGLPEGVKLIIASPTVATGVSDESQDRYSKVYGIFTGVSSTDADIAQALGRVREPVERVVWCAKYGRNFSKVSRSTNALEVKRHLLDRTSATVSLVRSSLREDIAGEIGSIDWSSDPHINLWAKIEADRNRSMLSLRDSLLVRLRSEGNQVSVRQQETNAAVKALLKAAGAELKEADALAILEARILSLEEAIRLNSKENTDAEDKRAIDRFWLCDFYAIDPKSLTLEMVLADGSGRRRGELRSLEEFLYPGVAVDRTVKALEQQARWNQGCSPWDISSAELRRAMREKLELGQIIDRLRSGETLMSSDYSHYADRVRQLALQTKLALNVTVKIDMSDAQIINQLLSQLGIKLKRQQSRKSGKRISSYLLSSSHWGEAIAVLERRKARRDRGQGEAEFTGTPPHLYIQNRGGVPVELKPETHDIAPIQGDRVKVGSLVKVGSHLATVVELDEDYAKLQGLTIVGWQRLDELAIAS